MRFLHTADWQIGMAAAHTGPVAARVQQARLDSARRVVDLCGECDVDFLLIAGDTFEDNAVDRALVTEVASTLAAAPCPVHVIAGNHDALEPGSVWEHSIWSRFPQIHVHRSREPVALNGGTLFPCPLFHRQKGEDPTSWIPTRADSDGIRIGLAHGHVPLPTMESECNYRIGLDTAEQLGLDYLALGHWHSANVLTPRLAYSGTHETTKFGERDSGTALLVAIASTGELPAIQILRTGKLDWVQLNSAISMEGDLAAVLAAVGKIPRPASTLLRLTLSGHLFPEEAEVRELLRSQSSNFLFLSIEDAGLLPAPGDHSWADSLPSGTIRQTAMRLIQLGTPKAQQALLQLNRIAREVAQV